MADLEGTIYISLSHGKILKRSGFGTLKPYVIFFIGNSSVRTVEASSKNPTWGICVDLKRKKEGALLFKVFDKGMISDSFIGEGAIQLGNLLTNKKEKSNYPVYKHDKKVGELAISLEFEPVAPIQRTQSTPYSQPINPQFPNPHSMNPQYAPMQPYMQAPMQPMQPYMQAPMQPMQPMQAPVQAPMQPMQAAMQAQPMQPPQVQQTRPSSSVDILTHGIKLSDIRFDKKIYQSQNGKQEIHIGIVVPANLKVAVKVNYCSNNDEFNQVQREALTMCQVNHPNICKVYTTLLDNRNGQLNNLIVMEKCEGSDLGKEIEARAKKGQFWTEQELWCHFTALLSAFKEIQSKHIVHSDVKPQNIVMTPERVAKVIDFGISLQSYTEFFANTQTYKVGGTVPYFSPLQMQGYMAFLKGERQEATVRHNPSKSDVFALGLTFYHMASLRQPSGLNDLSPDLEQKISNAVNSLNYSQKLKSLISAMLTIDENRRPDFLELNNSS